MSGLLRSILALALTVAFITFFNAMPLTQNIKTVGMVVSLIFAIIFIGLAFVSVLDSLED